ncbi:MAG TPA: FadR/GntR family transcriptional regulator [Gaiellaceae bacterium]|nr:FadR/GntR family transcriptional regulator [Gaiellaceae bacterium]
MNGFFTPVSTGRISTDIVDQIKAAIREGRLAPGDQLPPERDLTRQLGVSRVSVRDALRILEATGLVEVKVGARGGAFVTAPAPHLVAEGIADMLRLADVTPSEVTETRLVFELALLPLACERADEADLAALEEICDRAEAAFSAGAYDVARSAEFHTRLGGCTHNTAVALFAEVLQGPLLRSLQQAKRADPAAGGTGLLEHRALVDAIRARDPERARAIMAEHVGRTAKRIAH